MADRQFIVPGSGIVMVESMTDKDMIIPGGGIFRYFPLPTSGDWIIDLHIPDSKGLGGFATDGSFHGEADSDNAFAFDWDRDRIAPAVVIHDWPLMSGASPGTEHLVGHWKCDDTDADTVIVDETGNYNGTLVNATCDEVTNADAVRGKSFLLNGTDEYLDLSAAIAGLTDTDKFTIMIKFKPNFSYAVASHQDLIGIGSSVNNRLLFYYNYAATYDQFGIYNDIANVNDYLEKTANKTYTSDNDFQQWHTFIISVDLTKDLIVLAHNGEVLYAHTITQSWAATVDEFYIGKDVAAVDFGAYYIDSVKLYNDCILPYGAYHIGNGAGLLADIDKPHSDLSWFFDGQAALAKGGTTLGTDKNPTNTGGQFAALDPIVGTNVWDSNGTGNVLTIADASEDIVDYNKGFVAGWFKVIAASGGEYLIDCYSDADNRIKAVLDASNNIDVTYESQGTEETITGDIAITDGSWFWLLITWDDTGYLHSYINGVENGTTQAIANTWGGGDTLTWYFTEDKDDGNGVDAHIGTLWMGKDPGCPQVWTNFGQPLWMPLMKDES